MVAVSAMLIVLAGCARTSVRGVAERQASSPVRVVHLELTEALSRVTAHVELKEAADGRVTGRFWRSMSASTAQRRASQIYDCDFSLTRNSDGEFMCEPKVNSVNWREMLRTLDQLGVMKPPAVDGAPNRVCMDGSQWEMTVRTLNPQRAIRDAEACDIQGEIRKRYSAGIRRVISNIDAAARTDDHATIASLFPKRILQVRRDGGLGNFAYHFEIVEQYNDTVTGHFWRSTVGRPSSADSARFGCVFMDAYDEQNTWACEPRSSTIDWREVRDGLNRVGISHPPSPDDRSIYWQCRDGYRWHVTSRYPAGGWQIGDLQACGAPPANDERRRYEAAVDSIIRAVDAHFMPRRK